MITEFLDIYNKYKELNLQEEIDYEKFFLYSIITHSTAIEGSTVSEIDNQLLFDENKTSEKYSMVELLMNYDLKEAYIYSKELIELQTPFSIEMLCSIASHVMKNTGGIHNAIGGTFDSSKGDLRKLNVTAGPGGSSYMSFQKVEAKLKDFCEWTNNMMEKLKEEGNIEEKYAFTFDAHYYLVTIHPWADGNGRTSRLIMNHLQTELNLVPVKITKEHKDQYITALVKTREEENVDIFREFMFKEHVYNLRQEIKQHEKSLKNEFRIPVLKKKNIVSKKIKR